MRPRMIVVAGPAGSGKSTAFPVAATGVDYFNIDDRAAALNNGTYRNIPMEVRAQAIKECEEFIADHIRERKSFAVETTLRTDITLQQARLARANGFSLQMRYVAIVDPETNVERVANRAERGGHAATPGRLREIREASLKTSPMPSGSSTAFARMTTADGQSDPAWSSRPAKANFTTWKMNLLLG